MRDLVVMIIPIDVTPLPTVTDVKDLHPKNAMLPYDCSYVLSGRFCNRNSDSTNDASRDSNGCQGYAIFKSTITL